MTRSVADILDGLADSLVVRALEIKAEVLTSPESFDPAVAGSGLALAEIALALAKAASLARSEEQGR